MYNKKWFREGTMVIGKPNYETIMEFHCEKNIFVITYIKIPVSLKENQKVNITIKTWAQTHFL